MMEDEHSAIDLAMCASDFTDLDLKSVELSLHLAGMYLGESAVRDIAMIAWLQPALPFGPRDRQAQQEAIHKIS